MPGRPPRRSVDRHDFKIGIMCALPIEADLVERLFDERVTTRTYGDPNTYTTGVMADQNVVLAYCPRMGSNNAAQVATSMKNSFSGIEVIIVVGICGAVPVYENEPLQRQEEIWLGDCLISTAVLQTDFGRIQPHGFEMKDGKDGLGKPGPLLNAIMAKLQTSQNRAELAEDLKSHLLVLQEKDPISVSYPVQLDQLKCEKNCTDLGCGSECHILRTRPKNDDSPNVHFGHFGSSNSVVRYGTDRDKLARDHNIIAFEMEASGVWGVCHQTIVIKAACDYADSHKDKVWQKYAAAVAASGLKAFLGQTHLSDKFQPSRAIVRKSVPSSQFKDFDIASNGYITAAISPDFRFLAYGPEKPKKPTRNRKAKIQIHDLQNKNTVNEVEIEGETQVRSLAFDYTGKWLASSHGGYGWTPLMNSDKYLPLRIRLWNMETRRQQWLCEPHERKTLTLLTTMSFNLKGDRLAVVYSSDDRPNAEKPSFFIIDVNNGQVVYKYTSGPLISRMGQFSPDDGQFFVFLDKQIVVLDANDHKRMFSTMPISDNDTASFQPDGSLLVTYHNGDVETHFPERVIRQKLEVSSDVSFDEETRLMGRVTARNELIIVMVTSDSQQLCLISPQSHRCRVLSTNGRIAKILDISLDGQHLAWCELRREDSPCQVRVCNIQEELRTADIPCFLGDVATSHYYT